MKKSPKLIKSLANEWQRQSRIEARNMAQIMLDQYKVEESPISSKIEESLQALQQEVGCIKQSLGGKKKRVTLTQVNEKLDQLFNLVLLMNAKLDQHNALLHQIHNQS